MSEREKFEKWWSSLPLSYRMSFQTNEYHWLGWQAALSTRKTYGYGIVDKDGNCEPYSSQKLDDAEIDVAGWNRSKHPLLTPCAPYRLVELFYEDSES